MVGASNLAPCTAQGQLYYLVTLGKLTSQKLGQLISKWEYNFSP